MNNVIFIYNWMKSNTFEVGGEDTIDAGHGDNIIIAGLGADKIVSGDGMDVIVGDRGYVDFYRAVPVLIKSIDKSTDGVISDMESPTRPRFISKGLVLGYVQSGKTSNFTGVIAKACDAGYKFIIVLTGIHDVLRKQTQVRLDKELTVISDPLLSINL